MAKRRDNSNQSELPRALLPTALSAGVQRAVKTWLNTCAQLPPHISAVSFENLAENASGICFATVQAPAYKARYVLGGYQAEYRFRLIYRVLPSDDADMLDAVEALGAIAAWCQTSTPPTIAGAVNEHVTPETDVAIIAAYEDGANDYSIELNLTWEVC